MPEETPRKRRPPRPLVERYHELRDRETAGTQRREDFEEQVLEAAARIQGEDEQEPVELEEPGFPLSQEQIAERMREPPVEEPPPPPPEFRKPATTRNTESIRHHADQHFIAGVTNATRFDVGEFKSRIKE